MDYVANPVKVKASQILGVEPITGEAAKPGQFMLTLDAMNEKEQHLTFVATPEMCARMTPVPGDYLVEQEDGYIYLNPKAVFEKKYALDTIINPEDKFDALLVQFVEILRELGNQKLDVKGPYASRELAIASTKFEEGEMWARRHIVKNL